MWKKKHSKGLIPAGTNEDFSPTVSSPRLERDSDEESFSVETEIELEPPKTMRAQSRIKAPVYIPDMGVDGPGYDKGPAKVLIDVLTVVPWALVRALSWCLNQWQKLWRPLGWVLYQSMDHLDQRVPSLVELSCWIYDSASLVLHFVTVVVNLAVVKVMYDRGENPGIPAAIIVLYVFSHYSMGVIMFKELDHNQSFGTTMKDVGTFILRQLDVLFYDVQLFASAVHSNKMLEGITQLLMKGYEEARVALTVLLFCMPCCILLAVEYGSLLKADPLRIKEIKRLHWKKWEDQVYAALVLSVLNSVEKLLRMSLLDPWMHEAMDGFPLLYVRSNAARLPAGLIRDWLFRCKVMLRETDGQLILKDLYVLYTKQIRGQVQGLCDAHRAYLLRKAIHTFVTSKDYSYQDLLPGARCIHIDVRALQADHVFPEKHLSSMIAGILSYCVTFTSLDLSDNDLEDGATIPIMEAIRGNAGLHLEVLNLKNNRICEQGAASIAEMLGSNCSIQHLVLEGNPIRNDGGVALAEALKTNLTLYSLNLTNTDIGPEAGEALGKSLKMNTVLGVLKLAGTKVGSRGSELIAKILKNNQRLKELDLSRTTVDDRAAAALASMLTVNKGLEKLLLADTRMTNTGAQALYNALQQNVTLQHIDVSNNAHMDKDWQKLLSHLIKGKAKA